jgi:Type I restriction modification DNA specificity domain
MLDSVEWGEYRLGDLFEIENTFSFNKDRLTCGFDYDYVTRTSQNQGILKQTGFVNKENINSAGNWSLGLLQMDFFYREKEWYAGQFVRKIVPKLYLTKKSIHFFTVIFNRQKQNLLSVLVRDVDKVFLNTIIQLPTRNNQIDFEFMEQFITELEAARITELEAYLLATGLKDYTLTAQETQVLADFENGEFEWGEFMLGNLFNVATGRDVIIGKVTDGNIPLISHQHSNNGISKKISKLSNRRLFNFKNTLPLADRGVFLATAQNENFHIGTRVKALIFKDGEKEINARLFLVAAINKLQILFMAYSSNATDNLPNLNIHLPTHNQLPDYNLMETFISAIQKLIIKDVVHYADRKIAATKLATNM